MTRARVHEMSYERALKILFWSQGLEVVTEDTQAQGRADLVVKYRKAIYVFELKRDESAAAANSCSNLLLSHAHLPPLPW